MGILIALIIQISTVTGINSVDYNDNDSYNQDAQNYVRDYDSEIND